MARLDHEMRLKWPTCLKQMTNNKRRDLHWQQQTQLHFFLFFILTVPEHLKKETNLNHRNDIGSLRLLPFQDSCKFEAKHEHLRG